MSDPPDPQRILIIKPSSLGDIVHALPVPRLLRARWPHAHIAWLINDNFADLLRGHPAIDAVLPFDRRHFAGAFFNPVATVALARFSEQLAQEKFDLVLDLQGLFRSGWLALRSGAAVRIGPSDAREMAALFYTDVYPSNRMRQHAVDRYLAAARLLGCQGPVIFDLNCDQHDRAAVRTMLGGIEKYAVLMPGTNWETKRWPARRFAALVAPLQEKLGLESVVIGAADAAPLAQQIPSALNLVGKTTLRQLVALLRNAQLVIANDSGPMHIAAALGRPLIALHGSTDPQLTGPWHRPDSVLRLDLPCAPCFSRYCSHRTCLEALDEKHVLSLAEQQIAFSDNPSNLARV
jgi:lipopolysaccharide heptosyltransferase I